MTAGPTKQTEKNEWGQRDRCASGMTQRCRHLLQLSKSVFDVYNLTVQVKSSSGVHTYYDYDLPRLYKLLPLHTARSFPLPPPHTGARVLRVFTLTPPPPNTHTRLVLLRVCPHTTTIAQAARLLHTP